MNDKIKIDRICADHEFLEACCDISVVLTAHIVSLYLTFTCTFWCQVTLYYRFFRRGNINLLQKTQFILLYSSKFRSESFGFSKKGISILLMNCLIFLIFHGLTALEQCSSWTRYITSMVFDARSIVLTYNAISFKLEIQSVDWTTNCAK